MTRVVVEFYRTRQRDTAHAVVGRETVEAANLEDPVELAKSLLLTLNMPQKPDAMTIASSSGTALFSTAIKASSGEAAR